MLNSLLTQNKILHEEVTVLSKKISQKNKYCCRKCGNEYVSPEWKPFQVKVGLWDVVISVIVWFVIAVCCFMSFIVTYP
jgi:hypothetical protein